MYERLVQAWELGCKPEHLVECYLKDKVMNDQWYFNKCNWELSVLFKDSTHRDYVFAIDGLLRKVVFKRNGHYYDLAMFKDTLFLKPYLRPYLEYESEHKCFVKLLELIDTDKKWHWGRKIKADYWKAVREGPTNNSYNPGIEFMCDNSTYTDSIGRDFKPMYGGGGEIVLVPKDYRRHYSIF